MHKHAQKLATAFANEMRGVFPDGAPEAIVNSAIESLAGSLTEMLVQYGREVQEAAAACVDCYNGEKSYANERRAKAIREMLLP